MLGIISTIFPCYTSPVFIILDQEIYRERDKIPALSVVMYTKSMEYGISTVKTEFVRK